jgi:hypothetical protein
MRNLKSLDISPVLQTLEMASTNYEVNALFGEDGTSVFDTDWQSR